MKWWISGSVQDAVVNADITSPDAETGDKQAKILIKDRMCRSSMGRTEWPNYENWKFIFANRSPALHATGHH